MKIIPMTTSQMFNCKNLTCKKPCFRGIIDDIYKANLDNKKEQEAFFRSEVYAEHRRKMRGTFICHDGMSYSANLDKKINEIRERVSKLNISEDNFEELFKIFMKGTEINKEIGENPVTYYRKKELKPIENFIEFLEKYKEMSF